MTSWTRRPGVVIWSLTGRCTPSWPTTAMSCLAPVLFADLVAQGRSYPSVPTEVVATVMVLQALEGLSDREAISALRRDIAWKVACGLRLDDEGFHPTVLVYWRARLRASARP